MKSCLIVAGEKSGEEHVLSFLSSLQEGANHYRFWGVGGDEMAKQGVELLYHLRDFSSWGFSGILSKIPFYKKALDRLAQEAQIRHCDVAILVDFQGFNMRLAKKLKRNGVKVLYYVAPQAWVWKEGRVEKLKKNVHTLFTILPFEKKWFLERGVKQVCSTSHPIWLQYKDQCHPKNLGVESKDYIWLQKHKRVLLLPGSRNFEVQNLLPQFMKTVRELPYKVSIGLVKAGSVNDHLFTPYEKDVDHIFNHENITEALEWAGICLAASGTVTLTCALFQVPTIMAYESSLLNEYIFYTLLDYKGYISLANIVHEEEVFPELIQNRATSFNMKKELLKLLESEEHYKLVKSKLVKTGELIQGDHHNPAHIMLDAFEVNS